MIAVIVERPPGDRQGPDISDPLVTSVEAASERGRNEIDRACTNRELVQSSGALATWIRPGVLVEVLDAEQHAWRGMIRSCALVINRGVDSVTADINLEIEREAQ